jgi:hypothetical protein
MKFTEKYIQLYEEISQECFEKHGYYYPPKNWNEFQTKNFDFFEKYLKEKENGIKKTKSYIRLAGKMNDFGFYNVYQNFDFENFNNILFQTSRQELLNRGMLASGTDHCNVLMNALKSFSCNDFRIIDYFFPKELSQSKGTYYTEISVNLMKVLYYNQLDLKEEAIQKADKFLLKKITAWEKYVVLYFMALVKPNKTEASKSLQELCSAYQKMNHSVSKLHNKLAKCFASEIHGLYRFCKVIDKNLFSEITRPKHQCFSEEFELWQIENNFPKGNIFYEYPKEMNYVNKILVTELPIVSLHKPYPNKKESYKDVDKFISDLTENAKK